MLAEGLDLIKQEEGFHRIVVWKPSILATPYVCPAGYWTIGYGHLCRSDHPRITEAEGEAMLFEDVARFELAVRGVVRHPLNPFQFAALTSWTFNLGIGRLKSSTMLRCINRGDLADVPDEMQKWVYGGGKKLPGLIRRRAREASLWLRTG